MELETQGGALRPAATADAASTRVPTISRTTAIRSLKCSYHLGVGSPSILVAGHQVQGACGSHNHRTSVERATTRSSTAVSFAGRAPARSSTAFGHVAQPSDVDLEDLKSRLPCSTWSVSRTAPQGLVSSWPPLQRARSPRQHCPARRNQTLSDSRPHASGNRPLAAAAALGL